MSRGYGKLGRRSGSAAWQWVVIGMILGFGCSVVIVLGLLTFGVISLGGVAAASTPQITVITATPPPATPTPLVTNTPELAATADGGQSVIVASPTPILVQPTQTPLVITATPEATVGVGASLSAESAIPPELLAVRSDLARIDGATFTMGTTPQEIQTAVRECIERDGGNCQLADGEDSVPPHQVTLNTFWIETTEVTYRQYLAFLNSTSAGMGPRSHLASCGGFGCLQTQNEEPNSFVQFDSVNYSVLPSLENRPVALVSWYGARAYCEAIGRRLPTEAEWEYAARGPQGFLYAWGDTWDPNRAKTNRPLGSELGAVDVRTYPAGSNGLFEMSGNLAEWVFDYYDARYYSASPAENPSGPPTGRERVVRGGSWDAPPFFARLVHRQFSAPDAPSLWIGFRCASDVDPNAGTNTGLPGTGTTGSNIPGTTGEEQRPEDPLGGGSGDARPIVPTQITPPTPSLPATSTPPLDPGG